MEIQEIKGRKAKLETMKEDLGEITKIIENMQNENQKIMSGSSEEGGNSYETLFLRELIEQHKTHETGIEDAIRQLEEGLKGLEQEKRHWEDWLGPKA